jgi:thioredoxin-related protein
MKKNIVILSVLLIVFVVATATSLPINNFDTGAKLAKIEHKDLIVMFSTTTCPYCTKFINETYPNEIVQELIQNNYIFVELNEKSPKLHFDGKELTFGELAQGFGIRGTPSFVFFTYNSTPITVLPGYVPADTFSKVLRYLSQKLYEKKVKFSDYIKKQDDYLGKQNIIKISKEDAEFILKNDPYAIFVKKISDAKNKYGRYIVYDKNLASELEKQGIYNILLVSEE